MNDQPFDTIENSVDRDGNPAGGLVVAQGLLINWQDGPLGRGEERKEPNGAFVETVLRAALQRIEWYQVQGDGKFACVENRWAIDCIDQALIHLSIRTKGREDRGVEGTHEA